MRKPPQAPLDMAHCYMIISCTFPHPAHDDGESKRVGGRQDAMNKVSACQVKNSAFGRSATRAGIAIGSPLAARR